VVTVRIYSRKSGDSEGYSTGSRATLLRGLAGWVIAGALLYLIGLWPLAVFTRRTTFDIRTATWNYTTTPLGWGLSIGWWIAVVILGACRLWLLRNRKCTLCGMPRYQHEDDRCPAAAHPASVAEKSSEQPGEEKSGIAGQEVRGH
jgi:hypothetical protein